MSHWPSAVPMDSHWTGPLPSAPTGTLTGLHWHLSLLGARFQSSVQGPLFTLRMGTNPKTRTCSLLAFRSGVSRPSLAAGKNGLGEAVVVRLTGILKHPSGVSLQQLHDTLAAPLQPGKEEAHHPLRVKTPGPGERRRSSGVESRPGQPAARPELPSSARCPDAWKPALREWMAWES